MHYILTTVVTKFFFSGALNTFLSWGIYLALLQAVEYPTAYILSFISGIAIALVLNSKFVFETALTFRKASGLIAAYGLQLIVGVLVLQLLVEHTIVSPSIAPLCVMVLTVPLSFFMSRFALKQL